MPYQRYTISEATNSKHDTSSGHVSKPTTITLAMKGLILEIAFWNLDSILLLEVQPLVGTSEKMRENSTLSSNSVTEIKKKYEDL